MKSEIMDIKQASKYVKVKERTLYSLAKQGKIPAIKIGGQWRFLMDQLREMFFSKENRYFNK
jgi:excisionase family DNA binding protein